MTSGVLLGTLLPLGLLPSLPSFAATSLASSASVVTPMVTTAQGESSGAAMVPAGGCMGEGLLPVPDKLVKKIIKIS